MKLLVSNRGRPALRAAFFLALAVFCAGLSMAQNQDLAALSRTVRQLMAGGHFEEAIPICEQLVKAMPGNPGLVLNLDLRTARQGDARKSRLGSESGAGRRNGRTSRQGSPPVRRSSESRAGKYAGANLLGYGAAPIESPAARFAPAQEAIDSGTIES